ncbi:MAG: two-component system response regulator BaeR [Paraglaciecola psychrophila]|jgi:two-component system response regulator BaeR
MAQIILIVEDEKKIAALQADYFNSNGFEAHCVYHGDHVIDAVKSLNPVAILLDVALPGKDGMTLCREIRAFSEVAILMVTARVDEIDRLLGLELGADDYICKPFSPREVVARVKATLRRSQRPAKTDSEPSLVLNDNHYSACYDGRELNLTAVEFKLLKQLASEPGRIFSREQLMNNMYPDQRIVSDRTIDSHIKKLRKKIAEHCAGVNFIHSLYGVGYKYEIHTDGSEG